MNRRLVVAAGSTAVGAALVLSGCNGDGTTGTENMRLSANQALLKSAQKAEAADVFRADLTVTTTGGEAGRLHAAGQFRVRPALQFSARLDDVQRGGRTLPGVSGQALFKDNVLYAKVPKLAKFVSEGKPWLRLDVNEVAQRTGLDVQGLLKQVDRVDPADQTKMFTGSKDARKVGTEQVDGVRTIHYTGTVTVRDALNRLDAEARQKVRGWLPPEAGEGRIRFDLWADGQSLPRKIVWKGADKQGDGGSVTVLYSDYGKSFGVNPPPADQVGRLSLGSLLGGS
ncbi:hypothetical protein [Spirillospora albida]|uniref:hypothetical protein n=1 Tax=Spirillospora albida TaxID=58123 RepID=UPI0012FB4A86|nr:hypothetical protein [Spirillospora albida]